MTGHGFLIARDRLANIPLLADWMADAGFKVTIVDNRSTYAPLQEFLQTTRHHVVRLRRNHGQQGPWRVGLIEALANGHSYLVSDPDIEPPQATPPARVVERWAELLERYDDCVKVGAALRIDDLPDSYKMKSEVLRWEARYWLDEVERDTYAAPIDTTLALWRGGARYCFGPALRTAGPLTARHLDWYIDSENLPEELLYYRRRAQHGVSHWGHTTLTEDKLAVLEERPFRRWWRARQAIQTRVAAASAAWERWRL